MAGHGVAAASNSSSQLVTGRGGDGVGGVPAGDGGLVGEPVLPGDAESVIAGVAVVPSGSVIVRVTVAAWVRAPGASRTSNARAGTCRLR